MKAVIPDERPSPSVKFESRHDSFAVFVFRECITEIFDYARLLRAYGFRLRLLIENRLLKVLIFFQQKRIRAIHRRNAIRIAVLVEKTLNKERHRAATDERQWCAKQHDPGGQRHAGIHWDSALLVGTNVPDEPGRPHSPLQETGPAAASVPSDCSPTGNIEP